MPRVKTQALLSAAVRLFEAGDTAQAEQVCRDVLASDRASADGWHMLAVVLLEHGRLEEAAQAAERATALRPNIPPYWITRGSIEADRNLETEAQASFRHAIGLNPRIAEAHYGLARALLSAEHRQDALDEFGGAFALDPEGRLDRRECIDCLRQLQFDSLPDFWQREIERFFARDDIDKSHYAMAGLKALAAKPAFRIVPSGDQPMPSKADSTATGEIMRDALFGILLRDTLIAHAGFESFLTWLRRALLLDAELRAQAPLAFLCDLAQQCFNNEYVYAETPMESDGAAALEADLGTALRDERPADDALLRSLATLAMYRPLHVIDRVQTLLEGDAPGAAFRQLLQRTVLAVFEEQALRPAIPAIGAIADPVSQKVRAQYEANPYPRLMSFDRMPPITIADWLRIEVPGLDAPEDFPAAPSMLVAGCGTGADTLELAARIPAMRLTAVDLSLSSLCHARRKAVELNLTNIEFLQADILELQELQQRFDILRCTGVLHHMRDPLAGLRALLGLVRPGGLVLLGLYSELARADINVARQSIRERAVPATGERIRAFRQEIFAAPPDFALKRLLHMPDFFSMSGCRDLLFHVQEHQFRLPQIADMLRDSRLTTLNLTSHASGPALRAYREMFPGGDMADLLNWAAIETRHPKMFPGMYLIWCRTPGAA